MSKKKESKPFKKLTKLDIKNLTVAVKKYAALSVAPREDLKKFNVYGSGCGLCQHYYQKTDCSKCPVAVHTGQWNCANTPWAGNADVDMADLLEHAVAGGSLRPLRARALQEAKFLQSLLDNSPE